MKCSYRFSTSAALLVSALFSSSAASQQVNSASSGTEPSETAASELTAQWVSLFDGRTLDGWSIQGGNAKYRIEGDTIVGTTVEGSPNTFLCTTRDYANFELQLEVKCDVALNSGIQIRSHAYEKDTPQASDATRIRKMGEVYGYQCEIVNQQRGTAGNFWDEARHTKWHDDFAEKPKAQKAFRDGQWNRYRIVAQGDHIRSWVNDVPCADFRDTMDASGFIGLQVHSVKRGTGPYEVRWRNICLCELSVNPGINKSFENGDVGQFIERFEREGREVYEKRNEVVAACQINPGMQVADIGAGTGLYARLFAHAVGSQGRVYAVDITEKFVDHIQATCKEQEITNVEGIVCTASDTMLPPHSVDLAFICDTYHHFEFPYLTMQSIHRSLRPNGRVVVVDFERIPGTSSDWILGHVRAAKEVFVQEILDSGFTLSAEQEMLKDNYFLVFRKAK